MREYLVESLLHACVTAAVVETLLRCWRLTDPRERLAYRLLVLILPLVLPVALDLLAPFRDTPAFADAGALFASVHWRAVRLVGLPVGALALVGAASLGVGLFIRDVTPLVRGRQGGLAPEPADAPDDLAHAVAEIASRLGLTRTPTVRCVAAPGPVLFTSGAWRPAVVVSTRALARLDPEMRRAALAHELAHVARHDLLLGWAVMLARALLLFNPVAQVVARAAVQEMERRADDLAARATGAPVALAAAMAALGPRRGPANAGTTPGAIGPFNEFLADLFTQGRTVALEARRRRLLDGWPPTPSPLATTRFTLSAAAVTTLLFFVV